MKSMSSKSLDDLLIDTWWYALTNRLSKNEFEKIAKIRVEQGFSGVQLVVGIPPEVGIKNVNAESSVGAAWDLEGNINDEYLDLAFERINFLNSLGLTVVIYGAWGYQIKWIGVKGMKKWWAAIVRKLDGLEVVYCLTGEVDLWIGREESLLPSRTTSDFRTNKSSTFLYRYMPKWMIEITKMMVNVLKKKKLLKCEYGLQSRKRDWGIVLKFLASITKHSIIVHPTNLSGFNSVDNFELLSSNTVQTGHSEESRRLLWEFPAEIFQQKQTYINLEPWYEGIRGSFCKKDQLFAYWVSVLSGALSYCYGAHGIWNVGDGKFLTQWGGQTFDEAIKLDTPRLIGLSHQQLFLQKSNVVNIEHEVIDGVLNSVTMFCEDIIIHFFPEVKNCAKVPIGVIWLPLTGVYSQKMPGSGQAVIFEKIKK